MGEEGSRGVYKAVTRPLQLAVHGDREGSATVGEEGGALAINPQWPHKNH